MDQNRQRLKLERRRLTKFAWCLTVGLPHWPNLALDSPVNAGFVSQDLITVSSLLFRLH